MSSNKAVLKERIIKQILTAFAFSSLLFLFLIFAFILVEGLPLFYKVGVKNIVFGMKWAPTKGFFGIFPMIVSSFLVTFGALVIGGPLGLGCAVYLAEYAGRQQKLFLKPALELLAGIPSVVYGFLGRALYRSLYPVFFRRLGLFAACHLHRARDHDTARRSSAFPMTRL